MGPSVDFDNPARATHSQIAFDTQFKIAHVDK